MARALIDTTSGAGDTLKAGGDKLNAMTRELFAKVDSLLGGRKARIATLGESHSTRQGIVSAIMYSLWRYFPADVYFDYRTQQDQAAFDPTRGDIFGIGGTNTTHLINVQVPKFEAAAAAGQIYDLAFIAAGYNDQVNTFPKAETAANNIIAAATRCRDAGTRLVVICGLFPNGTPSDTDNCNTRLRVFAAATPGITFCDLTRVMADPTAAAGNFRYKGTTNTYLGYTTDGTHASGYARRMIAKEFEPYLRAVARRRVPRRGFNSGAFDQVDSPGSDITGDAGNIMPGTGGLLNESSWNTNIAGNQQNGSLGLKTGTVTCTPTIITGTDGFNRQRLTFGGTSGGVVELKFVRNSITNLNNGVLTRAYDYELMLEMTNVSGLSEMFLQPNGSASNTPYFGTGNSDLADAWPDNTTETLFMYSTVPETFPVNQGNPEPKLVMIFNNRPPTGTIDISRISNKMMAA
ncbi:SGNH/GDSL hydrolase family protein [Sphingomonas endolithica]|uniref:SGNH/GDSL hydrolase family protein n=1 Tax=Sphingomonas endolithica TaxID=2972485 RepID=UPI0021AEF401|nr:SGNH/GDSL hydrolase family protein [Sphingomonas sp. ZFBP2030]